VLPQILPSGFLPDGVHPATWVEIVTTFGQTGHRVALLAGLSEACALLAAAGCTQLWLDGSFVTAKPFPNDYDACWDPQGVDPSRLDPVLIDYSRRGRLTMKARFLGDLFIAGVESESGKPFVNFFRQTRDGAAKGIVLLNPKEAS
jgi:hypothetical protein